jgi:predicted ATPase
MIKKIRIRNFKSLLDTEVELSPLTVLIGRSGTGKSNFIQALSALQALAAAGGLQPYHDAINRMGGWGALRPAGREKVDALWDITFSVDGIDDDYNYQIELEDQPNGPLLPFPVKREVLCLAGRALYARHGPNWAVEPKMKMDIQQGFMLGWLTGIPEVNIAYLTLTRGISCHDFPGDVLAKPNAGSAPNQGFGFQPDGGNYVATIDGILGNIQSLEKWREIQAALERLSASVKAITIAPFQTERVAVSYQFGEQLVSLPLSQQSGGFHRFLAHLLAIYQQPPKQVLAFEEPENGIFPGALEMLGELMQAANKNFGTQFILTTHSPQLLDAFDADAIRVVEISEKGTKIGPLAEEQRKVVKENLLRPSELLTVAQPEMASAASASNGA